MRIKTLNRDCETRIVIDSLTCRISEKSVYTDFAMTLTNCRDRENTRSKARV